MDGQEKQEIDLSKLSLEELLLHKNWKARQKGYEDVTLQMQRATSEKDPIFSKYLGYVKSWAADSNVIALEKGLVAVQIFVENAALANRTAGEVCPVLVQKCLCNPKQKIRDKAQEILLLYIEIEKPEIVTEALIEGYANKNPKIVAQCVLTTTVAISDFGPKVLGVKNVLKQISVLLEHRDKDVREQTKVLAIELHRWIGAALKPQLQGIKPVQLTELEAEFEKEKESATKPMPTRYLRSQKPQDTAASVVNGSAENGGDVAYSESSAVNIQADVDPWQYLTPTDILSKLPKNFYEQLESTKWAERKECLDILLKLLNDNPRLDPACNYGELASVLKKILAKDSNINVVATAAKILAGLATGLRKKFSQFVAMFVPIVLEKFKEKKPLVAIPCAEAIDAIAKTTTLEAISEDVVSALDNKTPSVKVQTALFLSRSFCCYTQTTLTDKLLKIYCAPLVKNLQSSDPEVRDAAALTLGAAMKIVSDKRILKFLTEIKEDHLKMEKIKEYCDKTVVTSSSASTTVVPPVANNVIKKPNADIPSSVLPAANSGAPANRKQRTSSRPTTSNSTKSTASAKSTSDNPPNKPKEAPILMEEIELDKNWKVRQKFYEDVTLQMQLATNDKDPIFSMYVGSVKSWATDSNVIALEKGLDAVQTFVENAALANRIAGEVCPVLVQKCLCNPKQKIRDKAQEILLLYIEIEQAEIVTETLIDGYTNKNPKLSAQCVATTTIAISDFGPKVVGVKNVLKQISGLLDHRDKDVREKTKILAIELHRWIGAALKPQLQGIKPVQLTELESEFEKVSVTKPMPTRYLRSQNSHEMAGSVVKGTAENGGNATDYESSVIQADVDPWEYLTPTDILSKLPNNFYEQLESTKWAERKECLDILLKLLNDNPRLDPACNYDELASVLKKILAKDSNINVVATAAKIVASLAAGLRKKFSQFVPMFVPIVLEKFKEKKPLVAIPCAEAIDAIAKTTTLEAISEDVVSALDNKTPSVKVQTALFLSRSFCCCTQTTLTKKLLKIYCAPLVKNLQSSDPEVRDAASLTLGAAMKIVSERNILPFLNDIEDDRIKMEKIKEYCDKTVVISSSASGAVVPVANNVTKQPDTDIPSSVLPAANSEAAANRKPGTSRPTTSSSARSTTSVAPKLVEENELEIAVNPVVTKLSSKKADDGNALIDTKQKLQRFQDEKSLKLLKWTFNVPAEEHIEQLKCQLAAICKPALHIQMFHADFKQHLKALETLMLCIQVSPDATMNNLDLLLKWCTLRFFETNPSVLLKCLEYIQNALAICIGCEGVELHDIEVNSFVPYLLIKLGEAKEPVRAGVRQIIDKICKLYPVSKLFPLILDGCKTKNSRQKTECLEQLGSFIELCGTGVCGQPPSTTLKAIAQHIGDRDNSVRNAALNAIVAAYMHVGERVYKSIGAINEKDFAMLEERIKRTSKNRLLIKKPGMAPVEEKKATLAAGTAAVRGKSPTTGRMPLVCTENNQEALEQAKAKPKPATGMFQLEMEKVYAGDEITEDAYREPPKMRDAEIDDILKEPVNIPRSVKLRPTSPSKRVSQNLDALTMLDTAISQVTSSSMATSIQALVQLDEIIKDSSKAHFLAGKIDQLLMAVYFQLRMAYNTHMNDNSLKQNDVVRLYRHLCVVLLSLCSAGELVKEASEGSLKDLVCQLLTVLVDDRLNNTNEGTELIRSINMLIVNLVTKSDHTSCLVALMHLLRDTLHSQTASGKFLELVMRCIWKLSRQLSTFADQLQIDRILFEAHQFFTDFPNATWKTRPSNTPARTVKTILNSLCQIYSDKILDFVGLIEHPETSEAVMYLKKCLNDAGVKQSSSSDPLSSGSVSVKEEDVSNQSNEVVEANIVLPSNQQPVARVLNKHLRAELTEILKKIGSKETTKEGLVDLYDYLQNHPEADVDSFYKKASPHFQNYIQKNLKKIGDDRKKMTASTAPSADSRETDATSVSGTESVNYLETLQKLRANCGLEPTLVKTPVGSKQNDDLGDFDLPQVRSGTDLNSESKKSDDVESTSDGIDNLKKRLELIKKRAL